MIFDQNMGPSITPATMQSAAAGGQKAPPYLQARTAPRPGMQPKPIITPKASAPGDVMAPKNTAMPTPGTPPPQKGGGTLADVYKFFQSDLENKKNQALADTRADAEKRGVFYGTPLTGSEADINTQYLRGVGQLQAGMYGNEQENTMRKLGLAVQLMGQEGQNAPPMPGGLDFSALGALFAQPREGPTAPKMTPPNPGKPNSLPVPPQTVKQPNGLPPIRYNPNING